MKHLYWKKFLFLYSLLTVALIISNSYSCRSAKIPLEFPTDTLITNPENRGKTLEISFLRGEQHNYPLMALWTTDINNNYIETLYVAESIAKGIFDQGDNKTGKWIPGPIRRPAAIPVWAKSRAVRETDSLFIPTPKTPMPDAITGATPQNNFILRTKITEQSPTEIYIFFEINQAWDWNEYWTNNKYPNDEEYKTSCQPSLIYKALINLDSEQKTYNLELIGHGHYSGKNGEINSDLSSITTARNITRKISVEIVD